MITGYFDDENKWTIWEKKEFEFFSPSFDYHLMTTLNKHPTATTLWKVHEGCPRSLWYDYNGRFYCHIDNLIFMVRGTLIHKNALCNVPFKEFFILVDKLFGSLDGYDYNKGIIYEVKTVSSIPKVIPPAHAFQLLVYMWMMKHHNLPFERFKSFYATWWSTRTFDESYKVLPGLLGFQPEGGLTKMIESLLTKFDVIVNKENVDELYGNTEKCIGCPYWNICDTGKRYCVEHFKNTGKTPKLSPIWYESDLSSLGKDWIYRSNKLIETYANGGGI